MRLDKREGQRALAVIAVVGLLLYYAKPKTDQGGYSSEVIPPDEPTLVDWVEAGGTLFFI